MRTSSARPSSTPTSTGAELAQSAGASRPAPTQEYSPGFITGLKRYFFPWARRWFRPTISGWENLPETPFLCVANHSGYGVMEILTLLGLWVDRFGLTRPVVGLAHDIGLWWPFRIVVRRIGGVRASGAAGVRPLAEGFPVLVFPGGDLDALRPFTARDTVVWGTRHGFLRTARDARVPVVPLVISGSHAQYTLLPGGPLIARLLGLRRVRLATWPIPLGGYLLLGAVGAWMAGMLSGGWVWLTLAMALFPNPTRIDYRFLPPEPPPAADAEREQLAERAEALRQRMELALRELAATRRTPWG